ncbi:MAG TPA: peptidoglycan-binding domain-containing protein [Candidatus Paceibacterota bacterium]|nr:peptidoglycan-binding domain-containing protein [Candidatus Paceibacterota bacterium]
MTKKIIFFSILFIILPAITLASFFDDLLETIDRRLNNQDIYQSDTIAPTNNIVVDNYDNNDLIKSENCFSAYLEFGNKNNEVKKLQEFLSSLSNIYPEKLVTGYFGNLTKQAVMRFQLKYKNKILEPIGLLKPTGYVGELTLNKINELNGCYDTTIQNTNISAHDSSNDIDLTTTKNNNDTPQNNPVNISGLQTYQLTNSLGYKKDL